MKTIPDFPEYQITKDGRIWSKPQKITWRRAIDAILTKWRTVIWMKNHP